MTIFVCLLILVPLFFLQGSCCCPGGGDEEPPPDTVDAPCCETPIPETLHVHIISCDGTCACADVDLEITYQGTREVAAGTFDHYWEGSTTFPTCGSLADPDVTITVYCRFVEGEPPVADGPWKIDFSIGGETGAQVEFSQITCDPVDWSVEYATTSPTWCGQTEADCGSMPCNSCIRIEVTE